MMTTIQPKPSSCEPLSSSSSRGDEFYNGMKKMMMMSDTLAGIEQIIALDCARLRSNIRISQSILVVCNAASVAFLLWVYWLTSWSSLASSSSSSDFLIFWIILVSVSTVWAVRQTERQRATVHQQGVALTRYGIRHDKHNFPTGFWTTIQIPYGEIKSIQVKKACCGATNCVTIHSNQTAGGGDKWYPLVIAGIADQEAFVALVQDRMMMMKQPLTAATTVEVAAAAAAKEGHYRDDGTSGGNSDDDVEQQQQYQDMPANNMDNTTIAAATIV